MRLRFVGMVAAALLAAGCSGPSQPSGPVEGRWGSTFSSELVLLELEGEAGRVTGTAELAPLREAARYRVDGTLRGAELRAALRREAPSAGNMLHDELALRGTLRGDTLHVRIDGGRYEDRLVPLVRQ